MHTVTFSEPVSFHGVELTPDEPYLVANSMAGSLLTNRQLIRCRDGQQRPLYRLVEARAVPPRPIDPTQDYNRRDVWMFRMGGFGDVLMATPTIREIKRRWPWCRVHFVTMPEYVPALEGVECEAHVGFLPLACVGKRDPLIFFEGVIEDNPQAREIHAVDLLADRAGVPLPDEADRRVSYHLNKTERNWALQTFQRTGRRRIGVQATSSSGVRSYEPRLLVQVIEELLAMDIEVFIFGKAGQVSCDIAGAVDLAAMGLTFRQSVAVLSTCDAALVPDSSLQHVAGALDIPTVALFGSFPASLRVIPGAPVTVLEAKGECAPCHHHESGNSRWPAGGPCALTQTRESPGFCTVLASIAPARVVDACVEVLSGAKSSYVRKSEEVVYDFYNHKIGDTVAAAYLLRVFKEKNPHVRLFIADRGALPVKTYWPSLADEWSPELGDRWLNHRRLNFEFGNLWIAAPSAFKDNGAGPTSSGILSVMAREWNPESYDVGIHCLTGAAYNTSRNHDRVQFKELIDWMVASGLRVYVVPPVDAGADLRTIIEHIGCCKMWIGGDTGFTHVFAATHPKRPLIAIYGDDAHDRAGFEDERLRMRAWWEPGSPAGLSSAWCSDPLSLNLRKFVMTDHRFDMDAVKREVQDALDFAIIEGAKE